jgi:predicted amino acid racemase
VTYPRLDIDCSKIYHNARYLVEALALKNIAVTPVIKVFLSHPVIAKVLIQAGVENVADSRVENLIKLSRSGVDLPTMLVRTPMLSQAQQVVTHCEISLNTELKVIQKLSTMAKRGNIIHRIIIMVELGDLREGVMPHQLVEFVGKIITLPNIVVAGIGTNLACRYGVAPSDHNMEKLSELAEQIEARFSINLSIISGGNSASINWALNHKGATRVNHLRIGEAIFLGCDPLQQKPIQGLHTDAISLTAEVIESKSKPSLPWGVRGANAFGEQPSVQDNGTVSQAILAIGRQDVTVSGLAAPRGMKIVSSTSDHLIVQTSNAPLVVGQKVRFDLDYGALLSSVSSNYVRKYFHSLAAIPQQQSVPLSAKPA